MLEQAMVPTYKAILQGNRLEWRGDIRKHVPADRAVTVYVTLIDELPVEAEQQSLSGIAPAEFFGHRFTQISRI